MPITESNKLFSMALSFYLADRTAKLLLMMRELRVHAVIFLWYSTFALSSENFTFQFLEA